MLNKRIFFRPVNKSWTVRDFHMFPAVGNGWHEDLAKHWQQKSRARMLEHFREWQSAEFGPATDYQLVDDETGQVELYLHPKR